MFSTIVCVLYVVTGMVTGVRAEDIPQTTMDLSQQIKYQRILAAWPWPLLFCLLLVALIITYRGCKRDVAKYKQPNEDPVFQHLYDDLKMWSRRAQLHLLRRLILCLVLPPLIDTHWELIVRHVALNTAHLIIALAFFIHTIGRFFDYMQIRQKRMNLMDSLMTGAKNP